MAKGRDGGLTLIHYSIHVVSSKTCLLACSKMEQPKAYEVFFLAKQTNTLSVNTCHANYKTLSYIHCPHLGQLLLDWLDVLLKQVGPHQSHSTVDVKPNTTCAVSDKRTFNY